MEASSHRTSMSTSVANKNARIFLDAGTESWRLVITGACIVIHQLHVHPAMD
jgi:hypothetical protein